MENYLRRRKNYNGNWRNFLFSLKDSNLKEKNDIVVGYPIIPKKEEILEFKSKFC